MPVQCWGFRKFGQFSKFQGGGVEEFSGSRGMAYVRTPGHHVFNFGLHYNPVFNFTKYKNPTFKENMLVININEHN